MDKKRKSEGDRQFRAAFDPKPGGDFSQFLFLIISGFQQIPKQIQHTAIVHVCVLHVLPPFIQGPLRQKVRAAPLLKFWF